LYVGSVWLKGHREGGVLKGMGGFEGREGEEKARNVG